MFCDMQGSYVVIFTVSERTTVTVGAHGDVAFVIGEYGYVGSANGPGGIESRVGRHLETDAGETDTLFWHIDYILDEDAISIASVFFSESLEECAVASELSEQRVRSFDSLGASDCSCESHIVRGDVTGSCLDVRLKRFDE